MPCNDVGGGGGVTRSFTTCSRFVGPHSLPEKRPTACLSERVAGFVILAEGRRMEASRALHFVSLAMIGAFPSSSTCARRGCGRAREQPAPLLPLNLHSNSKLFFPILRSFCLSFEISLKKVCTYIVFR